MPDDRAGRLGEQDRFGRYGGARLGGVVGIVEPDAQELADPADAGPEARLALDERRAARIDRG